MALGSLGDLVLALSADTAKFESDLGKAHRQAQKFGRDVERSINVATGAILAMGAATGLLIKNAIDVADELGKMAQKVGVSTEFMSQLEVQAKLSGNSLQQVQTGLTRLSVNASDAARGTGEAKEAFAALGITLKNNQGQLKSTQQLFDEVVGKLASFDDSSNKTAIAVKLLGKSGSELLPLINSYEETRDKAEQLGAVISGDTAKAAEKFNDDLTEAGISVGALGRTLARDLLPILTAVSGELAASARAVDEFSAYGKVLKTILETVVVTAANVKFVFETLGLEIYRVAAAMAAIAQGDFAGAQLVWKTIGEGIVNARKELDDFEKRILGIGTTKTAIEGVAAGFKAAAPDIRDVAAATKEAAEAFKDYQKLFEFQAEVQKEANDATNEYFKKQGELHEKAAEDQKKMWKQVFESIDMERAKAIEQGEIITEGPGQTAKLDALRESLLTEEELELEAQEAKLERLEEFSDQELEALGGRAAVIEQMEQEHQNRLFEIRSRALKTQHAFTKASYAQQAQTIFGELAGITAGVAHHNRALFEINKVAAIANAVISTHRGIAKSLETYPWPLAAVMATAHAAAGFAQVAAIKNTSFGAGGGTAPSLVGATPATPVTPVGGDSTASQGPATTIHIHGESFSRKQIRELVDKLNEGGRDGTRLVPA